MLFTLEMLLIALWESNLSLGNLKGEVDGELHLKELTEGRELFGRAGKGPLEKLCTAAEPTGIAQRLLLRSIRKLPA